MWATECIMIRTVCHKVSGVVVSVVVVVRDRRVCKTEAFCQRRERALVRTQHTYVLYNIVYILTQSRHRKLLSYFVCRECRRCFANVVVVVAALYTDALLCATTRTRARHEDEMVQCRTARDMRAAARCWFNVTHHTLSFRLASAARVLPRALARVMLCR